MTDITQREQIKKAIEFKNPDYIPILFINRDKELADAITVDVGNLKLDNKSEWGFNFESLDNTMGQVKKPVIKDWEMFKKYIPPNPNKLIRFKELKKYRKMYPNKYIIASLSLSGFTIMTMLRGFTNLLEDMHLNQDKFEQLADLVFNFENEIIRKLPEYGADAVGFFDDWGMQNSLMISPDMWRDVFKNKYKQQFNLVHNNNMDVFFHSCGYIKDIIPDLIECGVDMLNLGQPNLYDIRELGKNFGGDVCFVCPVSYQTTLINGTPEDIYSDIKQYIQFLGNNNGGLIGYIEDYSSLGMSEENYNACVQAFNKLGKKDDLK